VISSLDSALSSNELVKVKLLETTGVDRKKFAHELAETVQAQVAQVLGKTVLLYRPAPDPADKPEEG
jgi:RNA-binding protein